jgi:hypothetical protein
MTKYGISKQKFRRVWRYQRGNKNPVIEEEQTTQYPKEKRTNNDLQNTTHKTIHSEYTIHGQILNQTDSAKQVPRDKYTQAFKLV